MSGSATATGQSVVRMANDIARNFAALGEEQAIRQTAEHIALFWDPRMKAAGFALLARADSGFSPDAGAALAQLAGEARDSAQG